MVTSYEVVERVAVVRFDNPPVNGLSHATREGIADAVRRATEDGDADAIVLTGRPRFFSAGADITEFNTPAAGARPRLGEVISAIEDCVKPVVAAIDGAALGGGLELALSAHYRVATSASRLGLPEVNLGLVPGAGGTQRLPRVLDIAVAAEMITSGAPRTAATLAAVAGQRLLDRVVPENAVAAAVAFASEIAATRPLPRIRDLTATPGDLGALRAQLSKRSRGFEAPLAALDLVELAATTSFDDGITQERDTFQRLVGGSQSAALRHAFFAERAARRIPGLAADVKARPVASVGVIGAGTMGGGIAMNFLNVGLPVTIVETKQEALDRGLGVIRRNYQAQVDRGKLTADGLEKRLGLLTPSLDYADVADCDLVIEAVFEDMDVKQAVFTRLDELVKPGAVLASNTSGLNLDVIAGFTKRPADVVGMHFFSPANVMKLLEVVRGDATADDVLTTATDIGQAVGKTTVVAKVCPGFIGNRMLASYRQAASDLVRSGVAPADIDKAIQGFGFAMGPFRMGDLAGLDIGWATRKRRYAENPDAPRDEIGDALCELGRFGQKTGGGWYDYEAGNREPQPSPVVDQILREFWERHGVTPATASDAESIAQQLVFALVDAGARILEEGIALRASDIDVVYLSGYGFPRHVGGPMWYADTVGLDTVVSSLRRFHGEGWEPAPLLVRLADQGGSFRALDQS
jgi:3-hydroxyacyl-CoA dehydrogenase